MPQAQQVKDALSASRENQLAIARTLLEDVNRIRKELGPLPWGETAAALPQRTAPVPRVHYWLHPVIPQMAISNADVVGVFMTLDGRLDRFESALAGFGAACDHRDEAMRTRDSLYAMYAAEAKKPGASKPEEVGNYYGSESRRTAGRATGFHNPHAGGGHLADL